MPISELGKPRRCGHCCGTMLGYASAGDAWLCHPDDGLDCYRLVTVYKHEMPCATCSAQRAFIDGLANALADCVVKATPYGIQDGEFVANYIMPTGPIHRAIPLLQEHGVTVRPGFDGRTFSQPEEPS